ncbi:uncharacterized protein BDZ99DRAFT_457916 [Mytilinidion resinicola]|uniref:2EXR domain-containing protein n=1 Tax=Mytilinidion resinicola TaxID=574789 RepID=A0A6A6Z5J1_9PEZI|nr:uncharacterized protein BDZ99DRAFT_457916 [Mytilinidion resinicola]KAF2815999.1 hypothetical protein BDZ99DRAFT_457916 [Mytilinidion resinicola]
MPRKVCRIRRRAGEPLGLAIYPAETFMNLPREVREMIYEHLLIDSSPIIVYSEPPDPPDAAKRARTHSWSSKYPHLTLGLLHVNRTIAIESASLFYAHNTFKFGDLHHPTQPQHYGFPDHTGIEYWDAIYSFLYCIGPQNRARLRSIEADISRPPPVIKDTDGTVSSRIPGSWMRKVHSRDQHTRIYPPVYDATWPDFAYDDVSPAIDAVFRILGQQGLKLQLSLIMEYDRWPQLYYEEHYVSGWSEEVPDHVEAMRKRFTLLQNGEGERVEVLWKGGGEKGRFVRSTKSLVEGGWEIVDVQDIYGPPAEFTSRIRLTASVCFTLKRKAVTSM